MSHGLLVRFDPTALYRQSVFQSYSNVQQIYIIDAIKPTCYSCAAINTSWLFPVATKALGTAIADELVKEDMVGEEMICWV